MTAKDTSNVLKGQVCPICNKKSLSLSETETDVPFFGKIYLFSMNCESCNYHKTDIESAEQKESSRFTFEINCKEDLNVRVVKSGQATVKVPALKMSVEPGAASEGYVSNVEGVLEKFKKIVETERDTAEDEDVKKTAKNLLKKLWKIELGEMPIKIVIEDPSGNSAIISDKAVVEKLKVKN